MALILRLGLIAMSGVRAHNEELTRLGLTLPGFVDRNKARHFYAGEAPEPAGFFERAQFRNVENKHDRLYPFDGGACRLIKVLA